MGSYDVAQVCLRGHAINGSTKRNPEFSKKRCSDCGAETITACPACKTPIRGEYHVEGVFSFSSYTPRAFCHECGEPYPWTAEALTVAKEIAQEMEGAQGL